MMPASRLVTIFLTVLGVWIAGLLLWMWVHG